MTGPAFIALTVFVLLVVVGISAAIRTIRDRRWETEVRQRMSSLVEPMSQEWLDRLDRDRKDDAT